MNQQLPININAETIRQIDQLAGEGHRQEAQAAVEAILRASPQSIQLVWNAAIERLSGGPAGLAVEYLLPLQQLLPDHIDIHAALAAAYFARGERIKSLAHCDFVLEQQPDHPHALVTRAKIALQLDDAFQVLNMGTRLTRISHPESQAILQNVLIRLYNGGRNPDYLNIGGGAYFHHAGWMNLDSVEGPFNPHAFVMSPQMNFPVSNESIRIVYSSHCLEHLDDATVDRVLQESRRVLRKDGFLVLKLPDFDRTLQAWRNNEEGYFRGRWNIESVIETWPRKTVSPTLTAYAAFIFCSYWNDAYGDDSAEFSRRVNKSGSSYFGPPALSDEGLKAALRGESPHEIASRMAETVRQTEAGFHFNHQNAWSAGELNQLLVRHGFTVLDTAGDLICQRFSTIPAISEMFEISMYCVAAPT